MISQKIILTNDIFDVSRMRYPKYNKIKRPRRDGSHLSKPKWYIYAVEAHLNKYHQYEIYPDDRDEIDYDNDDQRNQNDDNDNLEDISMENKSNSNRNVLKGRIIEKRAHAFSEFF